MNESYDGPFGTEPPGLSADDRIVALVGSAGNSEAASSAVKLATVLGRSRSHVLLASLEGPSGALDEVLEARGGGGFASVLRGEARIPDIAVRGRDGAFVYLPHGDAAASATELLHLPRLRSLANRLRASSGTLLLYLPGDGIVDADADFVDTVVTLPGREIEIPAPAADPSLEDTAAGPEPMTARLREAAQRPVEEAEGKWKRHQARRRFPIGRVAVGIFIVLALPIGWWTLSRSLLSRAENASPSLDAAATATPTLVQPPGQSSSREDWEDAIAASPELPYSVLLASYASWSDAVERRDELRSAGSRLYFIAPTPLGGALYYRVFAGATSTADSAATLMEELVRLGRKETVSQWDIRPVGLAFALGVYPTRVEAEAFEERLAQQRIPAYTVPVEADGDSAFQVYAGGFESTSAAEAMAAQLEDAGWEAELLPRRGVER